MDHHEQQANLTPQSQFDVRQIAGIRRYRSKSQRPCDLCRARKVLCNIPDPTRPCQLCERTGRQCTFIGNPNKKQKDENIRSQSSGDASSIPARGPVDLPHLTGPSHPPYESQLQGQSRRDHDDTLHMFNDEAARPSAGETGVGLTPLNDMISQSIFSGEGGINWNLTFNQADHGVGDHHQNFGFLAEGELPDLEPMDDQTPSDYQQEVALANIPSADIPASPTTSFERLSIDQRPNHSTSFIGFSNESDPFSLNHFPYTSNDEVDFFRVTYRKQQHGPSVYTPIHFLQSQTGTAVEAQKIVDQCMSSIDSREHLEKLVDRDTGVALVRLYFKFVFESLPILSRSLVFQDVEAFVAQASTGLLAGIYALALPFTPWDEKLCLDSAYSKPDINDLWQVSYTCLQKELHFPRLSTIQVYLLLLNHTPFDAVSVENPFVWSLAASMLAMAQSLGLNVDSTGWKLPAWEVRLRRRLWWAVFVEYTWRSVTHGRSSVVSDDDWDVSVPTAGDFTVDSSVNIPDNIKDRSSDYFIHLCSLTEITSRICRQFL
ncbi:hypothetical protein NW762_012737 [Fusarium torreyae]|uniref:Zn(2)-C6 fungal-type domain-containing protein n=1 Tax=Fusarium torreyae TaxID=1237075 RepID=A0A9W8V8E5_9HYPO|nr:hypothetical protein NW762_012737 [Fusarium torreyae]